VGDYEAIVNQ